MKIQPEQERKWEAMWKKWEKPLPSDSDDDIYVDMTAAVPDWKEIVKKECKDEDNELDLDNKIDFENAIEIVLDSKNPKTKREFWKDCKTFDGFLKQVQFVVNSYSYIENYFPYTKESDNMKNKVNEASDTFDWANDGYGKGNSETYTWKVLRKIFPNLQFSMLSTQGPSGWPEIKVSGKDRDVKRFMEWWNTAPSKDHKFWKKIMDMLEKIYGKNYTESEMNEADDREPLSHALDIVGVKASTANSKAQDEVQMTATDGDTYAGIDAAIDKDIEKAMKEIYK